MTSARIRHTHRFTLCALAALALAWALAPGSALARSNAGEELSPRLQRLASPAVRSAPPAAQAESLSLAASGPGSLLRRGGRVLVEARFEGGAVAAEDELRRAGAQVIGVSGRYQTATVAIEPAALRRLADVPGVESVTEVLAPFTAAACPSGIVSEGDAQLNAGTARAAFGVDGDGVTVGVLSDSFDESPAAPTHAGGDVASGDLPGAGNPCGHPSPVGLLGAFIPFEAGELPTDEGRAMAQIVHDLAPGAKLSFASATGGQTLFAQAIERLARPVAQGGAGAQVIVDDVGYFAEPFFQDGPVAVAVDKVAAAGVSYFSAAGNDNLIDSSDRDIASWEAPAYRPTACPASVTASYGGEPPTDCMDFDPAAGGAHEDNAFGFTVADGATLTLDLQWAEPWQGVHSDLDALLLDQTGALVTGEDEEGHVFTVGSGADNLEDQRPVEFFQWENDTGAAQQVRLAIARCAGVGTCNEAANPALAPRLKLAFMQGSGVSVSEYPQSAGGDVVGPTLYGHAGAAGAIATGAVRYNATTSAEPFSSRGPVTHYFGPVSGVAAAGAITPTTISKPDLAATDCGVTTFFYQLVGSAYRFCGTSAAAPHAAAVAALIRQANPGASAAQVRATLAATARPVGALGPNVVGAGLLDARAAVSSVALPPTVTIVEGPPPLGRNRQPTIKFTANRPVAFSCQVDGASQPCASPFVVPAPLADGSHGFAVTATDLAGRSGGSGVITFTVDTTPPRTFFAKHPPKIVRTKKRRAKVVFRFGSNDAGAVFICKVGRDLERYCPRRVVRRFTPGKHVVSVKARDAAGNVDPTPAVFRLRVKRAG